MEWISVKDRLPDADDVVLAVAANTGDMGIAQHCGNGIFLDYGDVWEEVTHWMPLPELPKE